MGNLFKNLTKEKKWKDYLNFKNFECKISLVLSILIIILIYFLDVYNEFSQFAEAFQNITIYIAQALIGMLGFILAGIAIIIGVLNKKTVKKIEILNGKGKVERLLLSFEFLALNVAIGIFLLISFYLILNSPHSLITIIWFNIITFITCYFVMFILFYSLSMISNCISIFHIVNLYEDIEEHEKKIIDSANELRIDFILNIYIQNSNIDKVKFIKSLNDFVDATTVKNKDKVKKYLNDYYS